ncbi:MULTISPECIES: cytochrome c biogenesis protein/redoxin [Raoultella]|uniref:Cytochrome c biogenesis protein/redoxin n=1 Tax=Raoultella lignicola TaxID=3040939 RepID=A0ABU9FCX2_9ENTR|nr:MULTISPECIES: cytochrome c biogenesis protein/redoxin [unclassified Raoultella]MRT48631.1 redoxin domain-containing protein [Raoultella sp. RIT712]ROS15714.1 cytochrome c biogenesis protein CcdA [Raoultella sp. BIGb0399]
MSVLIAFFGGMLTLLSPCTLPVIPLIFASLRGKRWYLLLTLGGMVLMFTGVSLLVTVTSSWVVTLTVVGRWLALLFLALVGLSLLSTGLAQRLSAPLVALGNRINDRSYRQTGGASALLAGLAIGLLWAPCAGPVLGAILSVGFLSGSSVTTGVLLAAYGCGCALMLALLGWFGSRLVARLQHGLAFSQRLRQVAGVAILASVTLIASGADRYLQGASGLTQALEQRLSAGLPTVQPAAVLQPVAPPPSSALPSLAGGSGWINSPPLRPEDLKGKVVLIDFWTRDCINCQHTLPHVGEWANKYRAEGLVVVGVHTPEYPWERSLPALRQAVAQWHITYPVVADNGYAIWNAFGNQYWPAHYLFDAHGQLRYTAFGEGDYARQEQVIQQLLQEARS